MKVTRLAVALLSSSWTVARHALHYRYTGAGPTPNAYLALCAACIGTALKNALGSIERER